MFFGEGGAERGDGVAKPGFFMASDDVDLPFAEDGGVCVFGYVRAGLIEAEEEVAFVEGCGFGGVDVFARVLVRLHDAA